MVALTDTRKPHSKLRYKIVPYGLANPARVKEELPLKIRSRSAAEIALARFSLEETTLPSLVALDSE